jgi:hypothetical protein
MSRKNVRAMVDRFRSRSVNGDRSERSEDVDLLNLINTSFVLIERKDFDDSKVLMACQSDRVFAAERSSTVVHHGASVSTFAFRK